MHRKSLGIGRRRANLFAALCIFAFAPLDSFGSSGKASGYHALLVGVQSYPESVKPVLKGPNNDVDLIRQVLLRQGFKQGDVVVLADGLPYAAGRPTRATIMQSLTDLAKLGRLSPGDFVYLHFAGHGSRQPVAAQATARTGSSAGDEEADGLDEIFLPADIGTWNGTVGSVQNAILDDEIAVKIAAIRARGASVWLVFDSCHSGDMARGVDPDGETPRQVFPEALGIPDAVLAQVTGLGEASRGTLRAPREPSVMGVSSQRRSPSQGGYVGFFAAQTTETAPELRLPIGDPKRKTFGLFSYSLALAMESAASTGASYRQVAQSILHQYSSGGRTAPTPLFEGGEDLDLPVFGRQMGARPVRQWPLTSEEGQLKVAAGQLNELVAGALLTVVPKPLAGTDESIGVVRIVESQLLSSRAAWVTNAKDLETLQIALPTGVPLASPSTLPSGTHARLLSSPVSFSVSVARPRACGNVLKNRPCVPATDGKAAQLAASVNAALDRVMSQGEGILDVVDASSAADIALLIYRDRLWFLPRGGEFQPEGEVQTYSLRTDLPPSDFEKALGNTLNSIGKVINLSRLARELGGGDIGLTATLTVDGVAGRRIATPTDFPEVRVGDRLGVEVTNNSRVPVDITMLLVDAAYGISPVFPRRPGESNRVEPGGKIAVGGPITADRPGTERMFIIALSARAGAVDQNFSHLAQASLPTSRGAGGSERSGARSVADLLDSAGFGVHRTRGLALGDAESLSITTFAWRHEP